MIRLVAATDVGERLNQQTAVEVRSMPRSEVLQAWDKGEMNDSSVEDIVIEFSEDEK